MSKFWRIVLAWWLAVALPIQGYAAQTLLLCGPASHAGSAAAASMDMPHAHALPVAGEHASAPEDTAPHPQDGMGGVPDHDPATPHEHGKQSGKHPGEHSGEHSGKCSVCASCCGAIALVSSVITVPVVHPDLLDVPTVKVIRDRVTVGGLERPPRSLAL